MDMQTKMFQITVILLMLAGSIVSCGERVEFGNTISVQYKKCECDREIHHYKQITENNILILDAEKVTSDKLPWFSDNKKEIKYVICDFTSKVAFLKTYPMPNWLRIANICNFPFDHLWDIPNEGLYISFSAEEFESCQAWSPIPETSYSDIVLTSLKIQTK